MRVGRGGINIGISDGLFQRLTRSLATTCRTYWLVLFQDSAELQRTVSIRIHYPLEARLVGQTSWCFEYDLVVVDDDMKRHKMMWRRASKCFTDPSKSS